MSSITSVEQARLPRAVSGDAEAVLKSVPAADDADEKARVRVRRLYEQTTTEELQAMWDSIRIDTLEAEVASCRAAAH